MKPRSAATRATSAGAALILSAMVTVSCTTGPPPQGTDGDGEANVADVESLTPVQPFEFITTTTADNPQRFEVGRIIVESWEQLGIPVELATYSPDEMARRAFSTKEYDTYLIEYSPTVERLDPNDLLSRFYSGNAGDDGSNLSGYQNPEFDELYDKQLVAVDQESRADLVRRAQELVAEDVPVGLLLHPTYVGPYNAEDWSGAVDAAEAPAYNFWSLLEMTPTGDRATLVTATIAGTNTLNPLVATGIEDRLPVSYIYDSLVRIGPGATPELWAAESVDVDGTVVTVTLRDGMAFHDGTPVTAEDVAFTFQYMKEHEALAFASRLAQVDDVSVDGDQVVFELAQPSAAFETVVLGSVPILPRHIWEEIDDPLGYDNAEPVGSGPFEFDSQRRDAELRMTANEEHFSPPNADGLVLTVYGSRDAMIGALETGDADLLSVPLTIPQAARFDGSADVGVIETGGYGWLGVHYNMRKPPFDDVRFRRALSMLIPAEDVIDIVYDGSGEPAGSIIAPVLPWNNPDVAPLPYDPDGARAELEAAGYVIDAGTLYYPPDHQPEGDE
ncbi:hypothetical protein G1H11_13785 [Phytoactinopolyspora alkaliphila]|uniref:Solute-binding protein family 5 domain-containing protein n=1 Tax=Phytoactinopolyspora alkaliphila TaxID=1783498 RepID=A0A6N9YN52_9ACTN|nr:ABC transporter substrate-binding protein [Phytoactinopolyspora alkaliphila]NED96377.1 hypothetical protein [Phytoactinopolyspora alkaliphila]